MHSPRRGVVMINSRYARLASSVWGIPCFGNRLLQVGLLSSIASTPLSLATNKRAVLISAPEYSFAISFFQPERRQLRARGFEVRVKNASYPKAFRHLDEHRRVFDI